MSRSATIGCSEFFPPIFAFGIRRLESPASFVGSIRIVRPSYDIVGTINLNNRVGSTNDSKNPRKIINVMNRNAFKNFSSVLRSFMHWSSVSARTKFISPNPSDAVTLRAE